MTGQQRRAEARAKAKDLLRELFGVGLSAAVDQICWRASEPHAGARPA